MYRVSPGTWIKVVVNACGRVLIPSLSLQLFIAFHILQVTKSWRERLERGYSQGQHYNLVEDGEMILNHNHLAVADGLQTLRINKELTMGKILCACP